MKRTRLNRLWCVALLLAAMVLPARADTGPKPSVNIAVEGLEGRTCYGTLISFQKQYGPHRAAQPGEALDIPEGAGADEVAAWEAFRAYAEGRGDCYFLQQVWDASEGSFAWTYYPPNLFQVVLWFPETGTLVTSQPDERYAFDSYFTLDVTGRDLTGLREYTWIALEESYDHTWELVSLCVRTLITIALEVLVAWAFGLRRRDQMACILLVNLVTQVGLNVALNLHVYYNGNGYLMLHYAMMELAVVAVETVAYRLWLSGRTGRRKTVGAAFHYALVANLFSFAVGWVLARCIPGIF